MADNRQRTTGNIGIRERRTWVCVRRNAVRAVVTERNLTYPPTLHVHARRFRQRRRPELSVPGIGLRDAPRAAAEVRCQRLGGLRESEREGGRRIRGGRLLRSF